AASSTERVVGARASDIIACGLPTSELITPAESTSDRSSRSPSRPHGTATPAAPATAHPTTHPTGGRAGSPPRRESHSAIAPALAGGPHAALRGPGCRAGAHP